MSKKLFVGCVAVILCGGFACDMRPFEGFYGEDAGSFLELPNLASKESDKMSDSGLDSHTKPDLNKVGRPRFDYGSSKRDAGDVMDARDAPQDSQDARIADSQVLQDAIGPEEPETSEDEFPTDILIVTCDSDPDEVVVPHPTKGNHFCETIHATPYRCDDNGSYEVWGQLSWQIEDQQVAIFPPGSEGEEIQHPIAQYDIFGQPGLENEPQTEFSVCVQPYGGWPPDHAPLCRVLPIRVVTNLSGPWCFSGETFQSDCDFIQIAQDGRTLAVEPNGPGFIWGKEVHFSRNGIYYEAELSDPEYMQGSAFDLDTAEKVGSWSAYKYTM